ncbi:MAG: DUF4417 domain-containing protein [Candidatus Fimenecus sp.]
MRTYEHLEKTTFIGDGYFDIPKIIPENTLPKEFISFNYSKTVKDLNGKCCHFFIDDYQFERVWSKPSIYLERLAKFNCVCTPDFSLYSDFPKALQIYNHYRKHWLGCYWQNNGIKVIPTISWSDESSFEWCFDGEPKNSTVAISSVGALKDEAKKDRFMRGYTEMIKRLKPNKIYFYGKVPEKCVGEIVRIPSFQEELKQRCNNGR